MRRLLLFLAALSIMTLFVPFINADEYELGFSMTPLHLLSNDEGPSQDAEPAPEDAYIDENTDFLDEWLIGFHFGYSKGIFYASLDSFAMPPFMVERMTTGDHYDEGSGEWVMTPGIFRPGFLNFLDVGAKLSISKIVLFAEAGLNNLYVYHQNDLPQDQKDKIGALGTNLRIGASYMVLDNLSVGLTGTAIFPNFETMSTALQGLFGNTDYENSKDQLQFLPIFMAVLYL